MSEDMVTYRDARFAVCMIALLLWSVGVGTTIAAYQSGRTTERQSRDQIACRVNVDSVRVVPLRWPSGPVAGARP